jgi:hypothetical protein
MRALLLALALSGAADAGSLAGVTLPDSATVGGQSLVLNGLGLREKLFIDIYVGGLYLPAKTSDAAKAIADDVPKRIVMAFLYELSAEKLAGIMRDSMESAGSPEAAEHAGTLASWMEAVKPGDQIVLDYVPGEGCSVLVKGKKKGTLPGVGLMQALWGIYLGPNPPTAALKQGMLGR